MAGTNSSQCLTESGWAHRYSGVVYTHLDNRVRQHLPAVSKMHLLLVRRRVHSLRIVNHDYPPSTRRVPNVAQVQNRLRPFGASREMPIFGHVAIDSE